MIEKFTNNQNDVFKGLTGAMNSNFTIKANALIMFNDENFIQLFTNPNNVIQGSPEEIKEVNQRAKKLNLL
jgi:hypothetical protein